MKQLFDVLITLHIGGGTLGLITGTIAAAVIKGKRVHLFNGRLFFYSMLVASLSALVISNLPGHKNLFLFAVGGFTLYMICSGYRIVWLKRNIGKTIHGFTYVDHCIAWFAALFGLFLVVMGTIGLVNKNMFGVVPVVFGFICINYAREDHQMLRGKTLVRQSWLSHHITRMMGAMIASYTAFLVVNVQIQIQWILWLLPGAIGGFIIARFLRKFAPAKIAHSTEGS